TVARSKSGVPRGIATTSRLCSFMNRYNSPARVGIRLAYQSPSGLVPAGASAIGLKPRAFAALPVHRIVIIDSLFRSRTEATASVLRKEIVTHSRRSARLVRPRSALFVAEMGGTEQ